MPRLPPEFLDPGRYPAEFEIGTRYADLDPNGHINNVAMAAAFEDARVRFVAAMGLDTLLAGRRVVIAAAHIDYLAEAHYPHPIVVRVGLVAVGRSSWTIAQLAFQQGSPRAFCRATLVSTVGGRPAPLPQDFRDKMGSARLRPL